jgi:S-adenosylmethionine:tRNA ribosyltransferase-isomerase
MRPVKITPQDFELSSYDYELPLERIAERPAPGRVNSRLMVVTDTVQHANFREIGQHLPPGATIVFNRSRVFPCRLLGKKPSGGEVEAFVLSLIPREGLYQVLLKASGKRKVGETFIFGELQLALTELGEEGTFWVKPNVAHADLLTLLEREAGIPIPPYIREGRSDEQDKRDYQTVYAKESGSVAAPTAGLHFTDELLSELRAQGFKTAFVTLHVGLGTFKPVKTSDIREHQMHAETYMVDAENAALIKASKGNIIAVGTTTLRVLESSWHEGDFDFPAPGETRQTRIFLHPGKEVHSIQGLITNFHLPQSSLLMLVSTLLGRERTLALYQEAVNAGYRFFSYGDAMLIKLS